MALVVEIFEYCYPNIMPANISAGISIHGSNLVFPNRKKKILAQFVEIKN